VEQATGPSARLAKALINDICQQLDQDKVILDRFKRRDPPMVCDGDGPFGQNRRYYNQFLVNAEPGAIA
jgi:hypothetical protein